MPKPYGSTQIAKAKYYIKNNLHLIRGRWYSTKQLSKEIGVSRTVLRNAIRELKINNVIEERTGEMRGKNYRFKLYEKGGWFKDRIDKIKANQ